MSFSINRASVKLFEGLNGADLPLYATDREALIALYETTGGEHWTNNDNWCTETDIEYWYGITRNEAGKVTNIDLSNNNLTGSVSSKIMREFRALDMLDFSNNDGLTSISLSGNTSITELWCDGNSALASLNLSEVSQLQYLDCSDNSLTSLNLDNNTKLEGLVCYQNYIESLDIRNIENLHRDIIVGNQKNDIEILLHLKTNSQKDLWDSFAHLSNNKAVVLVLHGE